PPPRAVPPEARPGPCALGPGAPPAARRRCPDRRRLRQSDREAPLPADEQIPGRRVDDRLHAVAWTPPRETRTFPVNEGSDAVMLRLPIAASTFHGAPIRIQSGLRRPNRTDWPAWSVPS